MLQINAEQVAELERVLLVRMKHVIIDNLHTKYPEKAILLGDDGVGDFVREHMNAACACDMTTQTQIQSFVQLAFFVVHVGTDQYGPAKFTRIMLTPHSAHARLTFATESLGEGRTPCSSDGSML